MKKGKYFLNTFLFVFVLILAASDMDLAQSINFLTDVGTFLEILIPYEGGRILLSDVIHQISLIRVIVDLARLGVENYRNAVLLQTNLIIEFVEIDSHLRQSVTKYGRLSNL
jgi:hypothetical protein